MKFSIFRRLLCGILLLTASFTAACSGDPALSVYLATNQAQLDQPTSAESRPVPFVVKPGAPARRIAQDLEAAGLITDAYLFEAYVRVNGIANRLEAGTFTLNPNMTLVEIAEALQNALAPSIIVTIPEGWRLDQTGDYLAANTAIDGEAYRRQAATGKLPGLDLSQYEFLSQRPSGASLEGYLYPDTYELPAEGATATDLLHRQLDRFASLVIPVYQAAMTESSSGNGSQLSLHEVLTLASIVEREAVVDEERPLIAGVYLNRLAQGMKLEADPTVQYAMGYQPDTGQWWKTPVFLEEYGSVDSPYNTYIYPGLPPTPIAGPSLSSIEAVLYPVHHNYLYFVALPDGSGLHAFSETLAEHQQNVIRYRDQ